MSRDGGFGQITHSHCPRCSLNTHTLSRLSRDTFTLRVRVCTHGLTPSGPAALHPLALSRNMHAGPYTQLARCLTPYDSHTVPLTVACVVRAVTLLVVRARRRVPRRPRSCDSRRTGPRDSRGLRSPPHRRCGERSSQARHTERTSRTARGSPCSWSWPTPDAHPVCPFYLPPSRRAGALARDSHTCSYPVPRSSGNLDQSYCAQYTGASPVALRGPVPPGSRRKRPRDTRPRRRLWQLSLLQHGCWLAGAAWASAAHSHRLLPSRSRLADW